MPRTRIKICGITRVEDGLIAARLGADAIGLVFHEPSPRAVSVENALEVMRALPPFVTTVGLFVDADQDRVRAVIESVPLDLLQFHGNETPEYCAAFGRPWMKAVRMADGVDLFEQARRYSAARALLVDAWVEGVPGGTGTTFDWDRVPGDLPLPLVLAGGLNAGNVNDAVRRVRPWAVDVSGGVEAVDEKGVRRPGIKSAQAIEAFVRGVDGV